MSCCCNSKNLFPAPGSDAWTTYTPSFKQYADFSASAENCTLSISVNNPNVYAVGKWETVIDIKPGWYDFSVKCHSAQEETDLWVLYTVYKENGSMIIRDHARYAEKTEDGYLFTDKVDVAEDGVKLRVELYLKGYIADVVWDAPVLTPGEAPDARPVTIALGYFRPRADSKEAHVDRILEIIDKCAECKPDVVVLSESMYGRGLPMKYPERAETVDGPIISKVRAKAVEHHTNIIYNFVEKKDTEYYNSSAIIDRTGSVIGTYHKTHLTVGEIEHGLTPGMDHPVFDLDFGRIGTLTCFDQYFSAPAADLIEKGAEIIFVPTAGDAREKSTAHAIFGGVYVAVAGNNSSSSYEKYPWEGWKPARIIDPNGIILADTNEDMSVASCTIDLAKKTRVWWLSVGAAAADCHGVYRFEKNPASYRK